MQNNKSKHYALVGAGKTGGKLLELVKENENVEVFNSKNPPTLEKLKSFDLIISFLPGEVFKDYVDLFLESQKPMVSGTTGFDWSDELDQKLKSQKTPWIVSHNFALGMNVVKKLIETLSLAPKIFEDYEYKMHEVHHVHKKDAPSGTALSWEKWLNQKVEITSERTGDVVGDHILTLKTPFEDVTITHQSKDRKIFASGALWSARFLLENKDTIRSGLIPFEEVAMNRLKEEL
ncbi:MAG: 4-hydroxy-tetrahydrodipicolinate reductase [Bacteriovoracaceae bacterium]